MSKGLLDEEQLLSAVTWHRLQSSAAAVNRFLQHAHDVGESCQPPFTDKQTHMSAEWHSGLFNVWEIELINWGPPPRGVGVHCWACSLVRPYLGQLQVTA